MKSLCLMVTLVLLFSINVFAANDRRIGADYIDGVDAPRNYFKNGDAEDPLPGWTCYADAAASRPVDGTGGTSNVTMTRSTVNPMDRNAHWLFTKDAVNRQGQGCSYDFTIGSVEKTHVQEISFDSKVFSGTFTAGTFGPSPTDSDLIVYVYDKTNGRLIEPSSFKFTSNSTTVSEPWRIWFQASPDSVDYRLIVHVATTSASAYSVGFENIKIQRSRYLKTTPITDWKTYTTTSSWATNTTLTAKWRQVGDVMQVQAKVLATGAPSSGNLSFTLPAGYTIDSTKTVGDLSYGVDPVAGYGTAADAGSTSYAVVVGVQNSTSVRVLYESTASASLAFVTPTAPFTFGASDFVSVWFEVPITGWSSSVQMSDSADMRAVALSVLGAAPNSSLSGSLSDVTWNSSTIDDNLGGFAKATGIYTVQVAGYYDISALVRMTATYSAGNVGVLALLKNGAVLAQKIEQAASSSVTELGPQISLKAIYLKVGDTLKLQASSAGTSPGYISGSTTHFFTLSRSPGTAVIAATEPIHVEYQTASGQSLSNTTDTDIVYGTKVSDTHGAFNGTTFTAPAAGIYFIEGHVTFNGNATGYRSIYIVKNGSAAKVAVLPEGGANEKTVSVVHSMRLVAGDTIKFVAVQSSGGSLSLVATASKNSMSIARIGM